MVPPYWEPPPTQAPWAVGSKQTTGTLEPELGPTLTPADYFASGPQVLCSAAEMGI